MLALMLTVLPILNLTSASAEAAQGEETEQSGTDEEQAMPALSFENGEPPQGAQGEPMQGSPGEPPEGFSGEMPQGFPEGGDGGMQFQNGGNGESGGRKSGRRGETGSNGQAGETSGKNDGTCTNCSRKCTSIWPTALIAGAIGLAAGIAGTVIVIALKNRIKREKTAEAKQAEVKENADEVKDEASEE